MIKVENITVRFGGVIAVNDVSIHVKDHRSDRPKRCR